MSKQPVIVLRGEIVEEAPGLTLRELAQACGMSEERLMEYAALGIIEPYGHGGVRQWRFSAVNIVRLQKAMRLQRDLGLDAESLGLVLDLLEDLSRLRQRLRNPERGGR